MYAQGPDKSALNDVIITAQILYFGIEENTDYTNIASTLKTAIDAAKTVADNDEADQDAVDAAVTALDNAQKEANDTKAVVDEIKALPESAALTTENYNTYKDAINKEDTDFNELSAAAQENVPETLLNNLTACKAIIDPLNFAAYKEEQKTAADNKAEAGDSDAAKAEITAAKKAIDDLTYDTRKTLDENKASVDAIMTQLESDLTDQRDADAVIAQINNLPVATDVTTANKDAIEAARAAYDALTDDQKAKVSADTLKKLTDAEDALAAAEVSETINALPAATEVTTASKDTIGAARAAYEALTDDQKAKVSGDTLKKLTDTEDALAAAEVSEKINALPDADNVTTTNKDAIEAARAA